MISQHIKYDKDFNNTLEYTEKNSNGKILNNTLFNEKGQILSQTIYDVNDSVNYKTHHYNDNGVLTSFETESHKYDYIFDENYPDWRISQITEDKVYNNISTAYYDHHGRIILHQDSSCNFAWLHIGKTLIRINKSNVEVRITQYYKKTTPYCTDFNHIRNFLSEKYNLMASTNPLILNYDLDDYDY